MAALPKEYLDINLAAKKGSFNIKSDNLAPEVASRFKGISRVEKIFYSVIVFSAIVLAIGLVFVRTKIIEVENETIDVQAQVDKKTTALTDYNQQLQELGQADKVRDAAARSGMTIDDARMKRAEK